MKGRAGAILAALVIVATGGLRQSDPSLVYDVVVTRTTPDHLPIFVGLTLPRVSADAVVFRGYAWASNTGRSGLTAGPMGGHGTGPSSLSSTIKRSGWRMS